jgi:hypothetical protein
MKYSDVARFEFRVFAADLTSVRDKLGLRAKGVLQDPSHETYIVSRRNVESNVKIRGGRLEVKGLQGSLRELEQWMPVFNAPLPVPAADIENVLAPALGIDAEIGDAPALGEEALMGWVESQSSLAPVAILKHRTLFDFGVCEAEFTELQIGFLRIHTVAVEAPEAKDAEAALASLGLTGADNVSYTAYLQRHLF